MDCHTGLVMVTSFSLLMMSAVTSVGGVPMARRSIDRLERPMRSRWGPNGRPQHDTILNKPNRPSPRLILLILTEKCNRLREQGVSPLPSFCFMIENATASVQDLNSGYDRYEESVPNIERLRDLHSATIANNQQIHNNQQIGNRLAIGGVNSHNRAA